MVFADAGDRPHLFVRDAQRAEALLAEFLESVLDLCAHGRDIDDGPISSLRRRADGQHILQGALGHQEVRVLV